MRRLILASEAFIVFTLLCFPLQLLGAEGEVAFPPQKV